MKGAPKRGVTEGKTQKPPKSARLNITIPQALLDEGMKLVDKFHFNGISDLIQKLLRDAVFTDPATGAQEIHDQNPTYRVDRKKREGN